MRFEIYCANNLEGLQVEMVRSLEAEMDKWVSTPAGTVVHVNWEVSCILSSAFYSQANAFWIVA